MPRSPQAFYDSRAGCWATNALGETKHARTGRAYKPRTYFRELRHPTKDRLAAQARLAEELERQRAPVVDARDVTVAQLTEFYLEAAEARLGPEAYDRAVEHLDRFGNWPGPDDPRRMDLRPARGLTRADAEAYRDALVAEGLSASYVADGLLKTLKAAFRWAAEVPAGRFPGLPLPAYPFLGLKGPVKPRRAAREVDPLAVSRFLRWAWRRAVRMPKLKGRFARVAVILLLTLRDTGARPKDLCVAEWEDWTLRPDGWGLLRLPAWKWKNGPKTGEDRLIAVPPHCARRIEWIRALEGRHPTRIFTHRRGRGAAERGEGTPEAGEPFVELDHRRRRKGHTKSLQKWFARLRDEGAAAGYPLPEGFRLYFNRSYFTTLARRRGVNDVKLAKALGTSVKMLDLAYTDLDVSDVLGAAMEAQGPGRPAGGSGPPAAAS